MEIKILSSGAWEGIPAPFCNCKVCKFARENSSSKENRTRTSIQVTNDNKSFLIEISPDIRLQSTKFNLLPINNFLISHWYFDRLYGLLELDAVAKFIKKPTIYCSQKTGEWINKNLAHIQRKLVILKPFHKFKLNEVMITPLSLYHMFKEDKDLSVDYLENTFGFLLENENKKVAYLPDYFKIPEESVNLIKKSDALMADGTYLFEEYFPNKPEQIGEKSDKNRLHGKQIFDVINLINSKKAIFHNISHLTEKTHKELQKMLPRNMMLSTME
ncbi:hypothetical protein KKG83_05570 [Candidatus Micrarchaeota archaeon]|nr:hypothetical protein [Candidatus Micrarchaeota archaeon]